MCVHKYVKIIKILHFLYQRVISYFCRDHFSNRTAHIFPIYPNTALCWYEMKMQSNSNVDGRDYLPLS